MVRRPISEEKLYEYIAGGEEIRRGRWEASTYDQYEDILLRFESFGQAVKEHGVQLTIIGQMCAYAAYLRDVKEPGAQPVKYNTVEQYLRQLVDALRFIRGIEVPSAAWHDLRKAVLRKFSPTIKANPLPFGQLQALVSMLPLPEAAYVILLWITTQRGMNLAKQLTRDAILVTENNETVLVVWYTQGLKGDTVIDRLKPPCHKLSLGIFTNIIERWWDQKQSHRDGCLFDNVNADLVTRALRRLEVQNHHPLLRPQYTMYSLKRGALQQAAAHGIPLEKIQTLSLHKSLDTLSIYIGSFLNPAVTSSYEVSQVLARPPRQLVPCEFPQTVQLVGSPPRSPPRTYITTATGASPPVRQKRTQVPQVVPVELTEAWVKRRTRSSGPASPFRML